MALQRQIEELKVRIVRKYLYPITGNFSITHDFVLTGSIDLLEEATSLSWIT
jgi:hypothetical protein